MRQGAAWVAAVGVAFASAVVLGEYAFTGLTPWAAAAVVPGLIAAVSTGIDRPRPCRWWLAAAGLGAAGLALGVWFSGGRGLQPWPAGGTLAVALGGAWPLAVIGWRRRTRPPARSG